MNGRLMRDGSATSQTPSVLIADDDETMRMLMRESLEQEGFRVMEAADGRQALDMTFEEHPDVVLLDIVMSGIDGFQVLAALRARWHANQLPVLAVTALEKPADVRRAYTAGATDFLSKPIHWPNLGSRVRYTLQASRAFNELERSKRFLESIVEDIPFLICRWLPDGILQFVNGNYCRYFGMDADELLGRSFIALIPEEDHERVSLHIASLGPDKPVGSVEHRVIDSDGDIRWQRWTNRAFLDEAGNVSEFLSIGEDITEKIKTREKLLLASEVFENSDELIAITEPDGTIVDINPAFCRLTGYGRHEVLGRNISLLSDGKDNRRTYSEHREALRSDGSWKGEIKGRRKNGETFSCIMTINAVYDEAGAVTHFVNISTDISHLREIEEKLQHFAYYEPLTDLPNRSLLQDRLQQAIYEAERDGSSITAIFIDLDNFKDVNESLGHQAGDRLLEMVAERLSANTRRSDTLAHLGGDEFILVMRNISQPVDLTAVVEQHQECLAQPFSFGDRSIFLSSSFGVAVFPQDGRDAQTLIRNADTAVHDAKRTGKNRYSFFSREMNTRANERLELQSAMRQGLEADEFVVYYQPKIDIGTLSVTGVEALLRWQRPGHGIVSPGVFIPLAEENGLIGAIGEQALRMACSDLAEWQRDGLTGINVAVNLSAMQLYDSDLAHTVRSILASCSLEPRRLELEITETVIMQDTERATDTLQLICDLGCRVTMDDFGTGYSSLNYLRRFPISTLKIDRAFIADVLSDPDNMEITRAIIVMAHRLGLNVVAEGVETRDHLEFLQAENCDEVQGYYYARPMPAREFLEWHRSWRVRSN